MIAEQRRALGLRINTGSASWSCKQKAGPSSTEDLITICMQKKCGANNSKAAHLQQQQDGDGGRSFRMCLMQFSFDSVVFQSFSCAGIPLDGAQNLVCVWLDSSFGEVMLWAAQKTKMIVPEHTRWICGQSCVPCWCPDCGLVRVLGEGDGSFSCWLQMRGLI